MKKYFLQVFFLLVSFCFYSCAELQPATIGGVDNPKVNSFSTAGADFTFNMRIKNPNKIGVTVFPTSFYATVNGIDIGKVKLDKKVKIRANSDNTSEFHIKSDFSKVPLPDIAKIISMVSSKSATISLKGEMKVGKWYYKKRFSVEYTKTINLPSR